MTACDSLTEMIRRLVRAYCGPVAEVSWASSVATRKSMQANRSRDTGPELALRRALYSLGLRYRVCARPIPGVRRTADVVFGPAQVAVEVRGCFWHGCPEHYRAPSSNVSYWAEKVDRNRRRDEENARRLHEAGWVLEVVWEHEDMPAASRRIAALVGERREATRRVRGQARPPVARL